MIKERLQILCNKQINITNIVNNIIHYSCGPIIDYFISYCNFTYSEFKKVIDSIVYHQGEICYNYISSNNNTDKGFSSIINFSDSNFNNTKKLLYAVESLSHLMHNKFYSLNASIIDITINLVECTTNIEHIRELLLRCPPIKIEELSSGNYIIQISNKMISEYPCSLLNEHSVWDMPIKVIAGILGTCAVCTYIVKMYCVPQQTHTLLSMNQDNMDEIENMGSCIQEEEYLIN